MTADAVAEIAGRFEFARDGVEVRRYGNGHIHDTYLVSGRRRGRPARVVLQRINRNVFREPARVMSNIERVIEHLSAKAASGDPMCVGSPCPDLVRTSDGAACWVDQAGETWRAYEFVAGAASVEMAATPGQAYQAALGFARFQSALADLPPPRLHETIPDFHHTRRRFEVLEQTIREDPRGRVSAARAEIAFARSREAMADVLLGAASEGRLPERVAHHDAKINNVLLDLQTGKVRCVVDLDTTMSGLGLYDFGDLVRSAACRTAEDEGDLRSIRLDPLLFQAVARGWIHGAGTLLAPDERSYLVLAGRSVTFELGIRFLTDFLSGDVYFRTHRPRHNLDRCRSQFQLLISMERQEEDLHRILLEVDSGGGPGDSA